MSANPFATSGGHSYDDMDLSGTSTESGRTLEPGKYHCVISNVEEGKNSKGTGRIVKFTFTDKESGGTIRETVNVIHNNKEAQDIGRRRYKTIAVMGGHPSPDRPGHPNTFKGLEIGVIVVAPTEKDAFTDKDGNRRLPNGVLAKSAPFYSVLGAGEISTTGGSVPAGSDLDDEIPF